MHYAEFLADNNSDNCTVLIFNVNCLFPTELTSNVPAGNYDCVCVWYSNFEDSNKIAFPKTLRIDQA